MDTIKRGSDLSNTLYWCFGQHWLYSNFQKNQ